MLTRIKKIHDDLLLGETGKYSGKNVIKWIFTAVTIILFLRGSVTGIWPPDVAWYFLAACILTPEALREISKKFEDRRYGGYHGRHYRDFSGHGRRGTDDPEDPNLQNQPPEEEMK